MSDGTEDPEGFGISAAERLFAEFISSRESAGCEQSNDGLIESAD